MKEEKWINIIGLEGLYQISSYGRVKSMARMIRVSGKFNRVLRERLLKTPIGKDGYPFVSIAKSGHKGITTRVHRLVAEAFVSRCPDRNCVNHIDGNKANNYFENLEWVNHSENAIHSVKIGTGGICKKHAQIGKNGIVKVWDSAAEIDRAGIATFHKIHWAVYNNKTVNGYKWKLYYRLPAW